MAWGPRGSVTMDAPAGREPARIDVLSVAIVLLAVAGAILTAALGVEALYERAMGLERARKDAVVAPASTVSPRARQSELLREYRWIDEKAGVVAVPIGRAMELVARGQGGPLGGTRP